jgi:hypothetical protein
MGRTALYNSVLLLLLAFAFIYPNCMTSTVSAGQDKPPPTYSGGTGRRCHLGQHCGRHATPTGNSIGTPEPGWLMPSTGLNGANWPGRSTQRRTRPSNPAVFFPILVTISIASLLVWRWRRSRRRNSAASQTHLVAVADLGQQTIKFMPASPRSATIVPGFQGRSR